jgi:ParB family chromosome partitioning protein
MSKITLVSASDIGLDKLVASDANVRRIKAGVSVEDLAEDIARRGLLQSSERSTPIWGSDRGLSLH